MDDTQSPIAQDAVIEAAVLRQLLALHPIQLTVGEVAREVGGEAAGFAQTDAVERAIAQLSLAGLLHVNGTVVLPTRAALRFYELLD